VRKIFLPIDAPQVTDKSKARAAAARAGRSRNLIWGVLGLGAVGILGLLYQLDVFGRPAPIAANQPANSPDVTATPTAHETQVKGLDKKNLPYTIAAKKAVQENAESKTVNMQDVTGQFARNAADTLNVSSTTADYDTEKKILNMQGNVQIKSTNNMTAVMDKAEVDVETRRLESRSPVRVTLTDGEVTADHLVVDNNGEKIKFTGRVKARLGGDKK
jgi:LPS export ABC transporter protein LptC